MQSFAGWGAAARSVDSSAGRPSSPFERLSSVAEVVMCQPNVEGCTKTMRSITDDYCVTSGSLGEATCYEFRQLVYLTCFVCLNRRSSLGGKL